jgi:putative oxidoreductase
LTTMDIGLLILRIVIGLLFVGHGTQKLFGWFGGKGMDAQTSVMERLGMHPPRLWAYLNALSEAGGGLLFALGLLTPIAAAGIIGSMIVAIVKVHWPNGLWNSNRGFEFPLVNGVVAFVVGLVGPGIYSLDYLLGLTPFELEAFAVVSIIMLIVVGLGLLLTRAPQQQHQPA